MPLANGIQRLTLILTLRPLLIDRATHALFRKSTALVWHTTLGAYCCFALLIAYYFALWVLFISQSWHISVRSVPLQRGVSLMICEILLSENGHFCAQCTTDDLGCGADEYEKACTTTADKTCTTVTRHTHMTLLPGVLCFAMDVHCHRATMQGPTWQT
jgi:hypothetical protein